MDFIDDKDFIIVRKNLNIFSVVIMLLAFTNANISIVNLFGITVQMDGTKVYIALLIGYVYFIWRYLTKLSLKNGFWNDFTVHFIGCYGERRMNKVYSKYRDKFVSDPPERRKILETDPTARLLKVEALRFEGNTFRQLRIIATFYTTRAEGIHGSNLSLHHDIVVPKIRFVMMLSLFCIKYDKFGDYLVPIILVAINLVLFFFESEWQGSMKGLFLQ